MKQFKFKIDGNSYDVSVEETEPNVVAVEVNGKPFSVEIEKDDIAVSAQRVSPPQAEQSVQQKSAPGASATVAATGAGGKNTIKAPIPGSIFKIEVSTGQNVNKGDTLIIMESMKMENNILASKSGVVGKIYVSLGQTVMQGDPLVDLA